MSTNLRLAVAATLHCLTECAIGEILGMVTATSFGWHDSRPSRYRWCSPSSSATG